MGESYEIRFNLTATNKGVVDDILAKLKQTGPAAAEASQGFEKFAENVKGFISDPLTAAGNTAESFLKTLGPMGVGAVGAAGAFATLGKAGLEAMSGLGQLGTEIHNVALRTGFTTKEVGQFAFAAKVAGTDIDVFEMAMRRLSQGLAEGGTEGKAAREELTKLGISAKEPKEIFIQVADVMSRMSGVADRNAMALRLFGRAGLELVPVMMSLNQSLREAKELDFGVDEKSIAQWEKYHHEMVVIETMWEKMKRNMKEGIAAPVYWFLGGDQDLTSLPKNAMGFDNGAGDPEAYAKKAAAYAQRFIRESLAATRGKVTAGGLKIADIEGTGWAKANSMWQADNSAYGRTKEGAEANYKAAQENVQAKWDAYQASKDNLKDAVSAKKAWEEAKAEAAKFKGVVDGIAASEKNVAELTAFHKTVGEQGMSTIGKALASAPNGAPRADILRMLYGGGGAGGMLMSGWSLGNAVDSAHARNPAADVGLVGKLLAGPTNQIKLDGDPTTAGTESINAQTKIFMDALKKAYAEKKPQLDDEMKAMREVMLGDKAEGQQHTYAMAMAGGATPAQAATLAYKQRLEYADLIYDSEKKLAELTHKEFDAEKASTDHRIAGVKAVNEYEEKIAQLHAAQVQSLQSGVFKALMGGGGFEQMLKGIGTQTLEGVFNNVTRESFGKILDGMAKVGSGSGLGKYLDGTMFAKPPLDPQKIATDANTTATEANTAAIQSMRLGGVGGGAGLASSFSPFNWGSIPADTLSGNAETNYANDLYGNPFGAMGDGGSSSASAGSSAASSASGWGKGIGTGVAVAGGLLAAYGGFKQGGARGDLTGVAGMAMAVAPFTGPAAPFIMAGAAGLEMISSLFGDPVVKRQNELRQEAQSRSYSMPTGTNYSVDSFGRTLDQGANGQPRIVLNMTVNALDMKSIADRRNDIAEIVRQGINTYAPLKREIIAANSY